MELQQAAGSARREDGELSDSDGGELDYTPLERPKDFKPYLSTASLMNMNIQDDHTDESEHEQSSDADSDSDNCGKPALKKRKLRVKRLRKTDSSESSKATKHIWCKMVQEDSLADDLLVCDVTTNNYLGIETYHPRLHYEEDDMVSMTDNHQPSFPTFTNKRQYRDRRNVKLRLGRRNSYDSDNEKGEMRRIPDLNVGLDSPAEEVAKDIASKLCEEKDNLILRIVEHAGIKKAIDIFKETKRIEEDGGMVVRNGTRRRTPGGVFIFLLKRDKDITHEISTQIFLDDKLETKERNRARFKYRNKKVEELKQSLTDSVLPAIRTRAEQWVAAQVAAEEHHVSNPPPSPATDGRDGSSDIDTNQYPSLSPHRNSSDHNSLAIARETDVLSRLTVTKETNLPLDPRANHSTSYDDDYLDIGCGDDMDLF